MQDLFSHSISISCYKQTELCSTISHYLETCSCLQFSCNDNWREKKKHPKKTLNVLKCFFSPINLWELLALCLSVSVNLSLATRLLCLSDRPCVFSSPFMVSTSSQGSLGSLESWRAALAFRARKSWYVVEGSSVIEVCAVFWAQLTLVNGSQRLCSHETETQSRSMLSRWRKMHQCTLWMDTELWIPFCYIIPVYTPHTHENRKA